jgi:predicted protein tyrosine phosphatase
LCCGSIIGESPCGKKSRTWKDNIKVDSNVIWREGVGCVVFSQDTVEWRVFVFMMIDTEMNVRVNRQTNAQRSQQTALSINIPTAFNTLKYTIELLFQKVMVVLFGKSLH